MTSITIEEVERHHPDVLLPPDAEFAQDYADAVQHGRQVASESTVAFVAICRQAMPWLGRTLGFVEQAGAMFKDWTCYVFENDSEDGTKALLAEWQDRNRRVASLNNNRRPHLSHTISQERTVALAEYRTECQRWVRGREPVEWVVVFDTDPWGGFSVDGLMTSLSHMTRDCSWYGLASYSWCEMMVGGQRFAVHYDAFALRWNHWQRRDQQWVHHWHPPVGSPPVELNSAFGQLAVYRAERYLSGTYSGEDCEHVCLHRSIGRGRGDFYTGSTYTRFGLNPSSRCVSFWVPHDGGQHVNH